ncbi:sodium ion-translocating decarboxylase subunit beta [Salmonella enterica subsp. enterica]|nr:sodium ion-translocating decarboxylase subunit beta [Salmonella enterica subsp. enterica]
MFPGESCCCLVALLLPDAAACRCWGVFCFGNLMRESRVVERLSDAVQNRLINIVTIFWGFPLAQNWWRTAVPATAKTLGILVLGNLRLVSAPPPGC